MNTPTPAEIIATLNREEKAAALHILRETAGGDNAPFLMFSKAHTRETASRAAHALQNAGATDITDDRRRLFGLSMTGHKRVKLLRALEA